MRVLHVTPFYEPAWAYGGMARAAAGLCRAVAQRGHEVTVATALLDPRDARDERIAGVRVVRFAGPASLRRRLVPWGRGLCAFLAAELPSTDLLHLHGHRSGFAVTASRAAAGAAVPYVLQPHGSYPRHRQQVVVKALFDAFWGRRIVEGAGALVAVSQAEARDLPSPARVVGNGTDGVLADGWPQGDERRRGTLVFVGSDRPQKRADRLPALLDALPDVRLRLIGPFRQGFLGRFRRHAGRVDACGVLEGPALASALASASLLVHPAVGEAFGLVPFEAALLGTAAVVAGGHGCGEWFGRASGCVVPPDDLAALAEAVRARLSDPVRSAAEARAVADFARRELTWERAAREVEALYRQTLDLPATGAA